jgi:hypothetical protein
MAQFNTATLFGAQCTLSYDNLMAAIGHLYRAMDLLTYVNNEIVDRSIDALDLIEKLGDGWREVNRCRLYTQDQLFYEELLVPSMGLINDAKTMLESLIAWKLGMTIHAKHSILTCIKGAALDGINPSLAELESCLDRGMGEREDLRLLEN